LAGVRQNVDWQTNIETSEITFIRNAVSIFRKDGISPHSATN
jgi:hypothetical protein